MTECDAPCCSAAPRRTVSDLFDRGYRRSRRLAHGTTGPRRIDDNGLFASFTVAIDGDAVTSVGFSASTCVTLIAYCELIAELADRRDIAAAGLLSPATLVAELDGVPLAKRDRAVLAIEAFRAALAVHAGASSETPAQDRRQHAFTQRGMP
jgi:hypothetical protein